MENMHTFYKIILSYIVGDYTYEDTLFINFVHPVTLTTCKKHVTEDFMGYKVKEYFDYDNDEPYPHRCFADITYADVDDIQTLKKYQLVSTINNS